MLPLTLLGIGLLGCGMLGCGTLAPNDTQPAAGDTATPGDTGTQTDTGAGSTGGMDTASPYTSAEMCATCHQRQYDEWRQSMHHYASRSPVFDAFAAKAYRDSSGEIGTFCTGCHTQLGTEMGEPGSTTAATRNALSLEGVTCDFCHSAVGHSGVVGNTAIVTAHDGNKYGPYDSDAAAFHTSRKSDFVTSADFCGSCHDVFKFPGIQIEQAYSEYLTSPAAAEGIRCQDCHMGVTPGVPGPRPTGPSAVVDGKPYGDREQVNHRFIGPDYSMLDNFPYEDDVEASAAAQEEYAQQQQTLLDNAIRIRSIDILRGMEQPDQSLHLDVELESLTSGHNVPTGFTSERQLWLHVTVRDSIGNVIYESGDLDSYGDLRDIHSWDVDAGLVPLDKDLINLQSKNWVAPRDYDSVGAIDETLPLSETIFPFDGNFIERYALEPLEIRPYSWDVALDQPFTGPLQVTAELRYRNLPPYLLRALQADELVERLRTFTIDTATAGVL